MAELSSLELTAGVAVIATALSMMTSCIPDMDDVLLDGQTGAMRGILDFGLPTTTIATTSVGVVLSFFTRSIMPTIFALGISAAVWAAYEIAFKKVI